MQYLQRLAPYGAALAAVGLTFVVVGLIHARASQVTTLLLYLVPVVLTATRWGRGPAILVVVVAVLGHDWLYVDPTGTLATTRTDEAVGLALLLFTGIVTGQLASQARHANEKEREATIARRSDELKTALLRAVSHDLKTPLASIKASASGLLQGDALYSEEDRRELLQAIEQEADRLDRLVSNLLDASRIEAGALHIRKAPQDMAELVGTVVERMSPALAGRPVHVAIAPDVPLVRCDYAQVDQILTNLLENAARHTPAHRPIAVCVSCVEGAVQVSVEDQGPGIPQEERERLFRPFERGRTRAPGTGLGLSIARGLAEAHGGALRVEDTTSGGARFCFTLPLQTSAGRA